MTKYIQSFLPLSFIVFVVIICIPKSSIAETHSKLYLSPKIYYGKNPSSGLDIEIPVIAQTIYKIKLFDQIVSYRNDKKVHIDFILPDEITKTTKKIEMVLEAYNDDDQYLRAIWFEVDGIGGYLGVTRVDSDQYRGDVTLKPKQKRQWRIDLSKVYVSRKNVEQIINFSDMLKQPGSHTVSCWISTYAQYGPQSWVSVELVFI